MNNLRRSVNRFSFCFVLLVCGLALNASAQVTNYYVSPNGNDSGDGSAGAPWATMSHAIKAASIGAGGTVIHVASGDYSYISGCPNDAGANVCFNRGGNSNTARLVLQCDAGTASASAAIGQCKIHGGDFGVYVNNASFVDIIGFDIGNTSGMESGIFGIAGTGNSLHIIGNYVHDLASGVNTGTGTGCPGFGEVTTNNGPHNDYQILRNIIVRYGMNSGAPTSACNQSHNIYAAANTIIENNVIANAPGSNIQIRQSTCNMVVSNNVLISSIRGIIIDNESSTCTSPGLMTINNNYFGNHPTIDGRAASIYLTSAHCTGSTPVFFGNNISDGSSPDFKAPSGSGLQSCDTVTPSTWTHQASTSFFVNYQSNGSGDYHLSPSSSSIAGTSTCAPGAPNPCVPAADFEGVISAALPIGAFTGSASAGTSPSAPTNLTANVQ